MQPGGDACFIYVPLTSIWLRYLNSLAADGFFRLLHKKKLRQEGLLRLKILLLARGDAKSFIATWSITACPEPGDEEFLGTKNIAPRISFIFETFREENEIGPALAELRKHIPSSDYLPI